MPQARFLGRRWRIATDSLPLLFYPLLRILMIVLFVLLLSLVGITLTGNYQCNSYAWVAVAIYGMTVIYFVELVVSFLIVRFGWRGGPLNEKKRMPQMSIMIHLWIVVEAIKLILIIWGLVVVFSPKVGRECWSNNPCNAHRDLLPRVCVPGATGDVVLTPACQVIFNNQKEYSECFDRWGRVAAGWMLDNVVSVNRETDPPSVNFTYPGMVTCRTDVAWDRDARLAKLNPFDDKVNIFLYLFDILQQIDDAERGESPNEISAVDVLPRAYQILVSQFISNGEDSAVNATTGPVYLPWNVCMSDTCISLLQNSCSQWRDFVSLPDTHKLSGWFAAIMFFSLAECILTALIFFISFNAFPDYDNEESWQGLLSGMARRLGYMEDLQTTSTDDGVDALVGIGGLLYSLFGGADLDVTDLLLGLYLVHLRQKWKRKKHALEYLAKHGYYGTERHLSTWRSRIIGFLLFPLLNDGYHKRKNISTEDNDWEAVEASASAESNGAALEQLSSELQHATISEQHNDSNHMFDGSLMLRHTFVRLKSIEEKAEERVSLVRQDRALITPLSLRHVTFRTRDDYNVNVSGDIVSLYLGSAHPAVDVQDLKSVLHFLPIARASYGLVKSKWRSCIEPKWYRKLQSNMIGYFKSCIPTSVVATHYQERNLKQILRMTDIPLDNVLYVSYASNPLGEIPYLIVLDDETQNVCISMRGTVGVADLITDLLSSPSDVSRDVDSEEEVYAHAGMTSSAKSMISEFQEKGIWNALCDGNLVHECCQMDTTPPDDPEDRFPLSRALSLIRKAIREDKYGLLITGHSLGAAVACLVASQMRRIQPKLNCLSFNPPGGLLDETLRQDSEKYCTSIVCGQDAISRMSIGTMRRLVDDMMFGLASCKRPKLSVLLDSFMGRYVNTSAAGHVFDRFEDIEPYIMQILLKYLEKSKIHQKNVDDRTMYPPGKIIFLRPYGGLEQSKHVAWDAVWIQALSTLV